MVQKIFILLSVLCLLGFCRDVNDSPNKGKFLLLDDGVMLDAPDPQAGEVMRLRAGDMGEYGNLKVYRSPGQKNRVYVEARINGKSGYLKTGAALVLGKEGFIQENRARLKTYYKFWKDFSGVYSEPQGEVLEISAEPITEFMVSVASRDRAVRFQKLDELAPGRFRLGGAIGSVSLVR